MRFEAVGVDVIRRSPYGDVTVATCYTAIWARVIARLLNKDDAEN